MTNNKNAVEAAVILFKSVNKMGWLDAYYLHKDFRNVIEQAVKKVRDDLYQEADYLLKEYNPDLWEEKIVEYSKTMAQEVEMERQEARRSGKRKFSNLFDDSSTVKFSGTDRKQPPKIYSVEADGSLLLSAQYYRSLRVDVEAVVVVMSDLSRDFRAWQEKEKMEAEQGKKEMVKVVADALQSNKAKKPKEEIPAVYDWELKAFRAAINKGWMKANDDGKTYTWMWGDADRKARLAHFLLTFQEKVGEDRGITFSPKRYSLLFGENYERMKDSIRSRANVIKNQYKQRRKGKDPRRKYEKEIDSLIIGLKYSK